MQSDMSAITDETMQLTPTTQDLEGDTSTAHDASDTMQLLTPVSMLLTSSSGSEKSRKKAWDKDGGSEDDSSSEKKQLRDQKEVE